jgi:TRAP-type C4-dicarboxylate transport system permease small subunit
LTTAATGPYDPPVTLLLRVIPWIPRVLVVLLMLVAMVDMLVGVFLRYVMTWVSATFDLPSIRFFWVEEIGEYSLAWLTFIGAALGIRRGVHFSVQMLAEHLPDGLRRGLFATHYLLLAAFGALLTYYGWQVAELNSQSFSPALDLNLRWLYLSSVAGGVLITIYSLDGLRDVCLGRETGPPGAH